MAPRGDGAAIGAPVAVIDANDAGCDGARREPRRRPACVERLFADNPLGQAREQTPICVVRQVAWPAGQPLPAEPRSAASRRRGCRRNRSESSS